MGHLVRQKNEAAVRTTRFIGAVARRNLLSGRWIEPLRTDTPAAVEIASILVQARPEQLNAVAREIEALPGAEIYSRDPKGKLVVVVEGSSVGSIGETLNTIALMPHVWTAALIFQGTDSD
jgi:nitrate reductase NapD